ncbi:hypothetical protein N7509_000344 [Penicillium cosmopolitanum]|uniref:Zn(2)-C6 fungal-type domain-containing protein n=1 Tax=Penicillium cosmopolitanum TaxID=1131564 RepID=A0A9X0BE01_9EURO|nr:uncharacterized protein N7509_000344 [Penicillium cosmopolitanum]KAJ5413717.1 hypothetical protein N7509_000344 [Penicillium cosmopolitanum]
MSKVTARSSQNRARSFGGCLTCRSRKVKCDEARPCVASAHELALFVVVTQLEFALYIILFIQTGLLLQLLLQMISDNVEAVAVVECFSQVITYQSHGVFESDDERRWHCPWEKTKE